MIRKLLICTMCTIQAFFTFSQCQNIRLQSDRQEICAPGKVLFELVNLPKGSKVTWNVGKGSINGSDSLYEFYLSPLDILASAAIILPNGNTCLVDATDTLRILGKPTPDFKVSRTKLCNGPDSASFTNITPKTAAISWVIDGTNYFNSTNLISHYFKTAGSKSISMVVIDSFGCRGISEFQDVVQIYEKVDIDFTADITSGCVPQNVHFSSTYGLHGEEILYRSWDFEGTASNNQRQAATDSQLYVKSGIFDVGLQIITKNGCMHKKTKDDYLKFGDSVNLDLQIPDSFICLGESIVLKLPGKVPGVYQWTTPGADQQLRGLDSIELVYKQTGVFPISLHFELHQCSKQIEVKKAVRVEDVNSELISSDYFHCSLPHTVHLKQKSYSSQPGSLSFMWNYYSSDGKLFRTSSNSLDSLKITQWMNLSVELITMHANGCSDTSFQSNFIRIDSIRPKMDILPSIACINQIIHVTSRTPRSSYAAPDTFEWVFFEKDKQTVKSRQKGEKVQISYLDTGLYDVLLIAANEIGCMDTLREVDAIEIIIPNLKLEVNNPIICHGESLLLTGLTEPQKANFRHFWELYPLRDSTDISKVESESFEYKAPKAGVYHLKYAHQILDGCRDSVVRDNLLMVNGLDADLLLDTNNGCTPLIIHPSNKLNYNYHFGNVSDSLRYRWDAVPNHGVLISDSESPSPEFTFTQKGSYIISLSIKNSSGCELEKFSEEIFAGVKAGIGLAANEICTGTEMLLSDASSLKPDSVWWVVGSDKKFERRTVNSDLRLRPLERGFFDVSQIVSKGNLCFDTARQTVKSIEVKSKLSLSDTLLYCAPAYAQFEAIAVDADTFIWDFGDGESLKTTDVQIANIYKRNSGWSKAYTITLISKSTLGCSDTVVIKDALQIIGPVPKFSMTNFSGCEPLTVHFKDLSEDAYFSYMNYNDGSPLDSSGLDLHEYVREIEDDIQIFNPSFYAIDQLGCAAVYKPSDSVRVVRSPKAQLSSSDSFFCLPDSAVWIDATKLPHEREWWFDGVKRDTGRRYSQYFSSPGLFNISLFVKNQYGCSDTLNSPVITKNPPKAKLVFDPEPCFDSEWKITGVNEGNSSITQWKWLYNSKALFDQSNSVKIAIKSKGKQTIEAEAIDEFGCKFRLAGQAQVFDSDSIPLGKLSHVSFGLSEKVMVFWNDIDPQHLDTSHLIIDGQNASYHCWKINSLNNIVDDLSSPSYIRCYRLAHVDQCGVMGKSEKTHCPIILEVESKQAFTIELNWTNYIGWEFVESFDIYRKEDQGIYEYLNTVDGNTLSYLDTGLCNKPYAYYVIGKFEDLKSRSNQSATIPKYNYLEDALHTESASVENDEMVRLNWPKHNSTSHRAYRILSSELGNSNYWSESFTNDTTWLHELSEVHHKAYSYQIQAIDHCGILGPSGRLATSILLRSFYINDEILLEWNPYEEWEIGVDKYQIELLKDNEFALLKELDGTSTSWVDTALHLDHSGPLTFRVRAIKKGDESVQSLSNTTKVIGPSVLWLPNAFSPNNNQLNETFKPVLRFAQELTEGINAYSFIIYNRWGEKIFETDKLSDGWDGYYLGNQVHAGTYMFKIHFMGADGILYDKEGTVLLMR